MSRLSEVVSLRRSDAPPVSRRPLTADSAFQVGWFR